MAGTVSWISIAPVKGMRMQLESAVDVTPMGVPGDRAFILVNSKRAMVNGKWFGSLMALVPEVDRESDRLTITFPDGTVVGGEVELGEIETITFYGQEERARPVLGELSAAISAHVEEDLRLMAQPETRIGVDRDDWGAITLLGQSSLESLREAGREFNCTEPAGDAENPDPGPIDARRFRMTFGVEGTTPYEEDDWIGHEVRVGGAVVEVGGHAGRCAVTTRDPDSGVTNLKALHFLRLSRRDVEATEALPFGVHSAVVQPGPVRLGDPVQLAE